MLKEIQIAFDIPWPLPSIAILDPTKYSSDSDELQLFGNNKIEDLCDFCHQPKQYNNIVDIEPPLVDLIKLKNEFDTLKIYVAKRKINHEHKISTEINAEIKIKSIKQDLRLLGSMLLVKKWSQQKAACKTKKRTRVILKK